MPTPEFAIPPRMGQPHVSLGQRPRTRFQRMCQAPTGRNKFKITDKRREVNPMNERGTMICIARSGLNDRGGMRTQGVALGWHVAGPLGRNRKTHNVFTPSRMVNPQRQCERMPQ